MVGNSTNFNNEDIIRTFLAINNKSISRSELVKIIKVGEGSIRTILDILKGKEFLESNKKGHRLSEKGMKKKRTILKTIDKPKKLSLECYNKMKACGLVMKNPGKIQVGFEQRDEAIRKGAYSAILFRYDKDIKVPGVEFDFEKAYPKDHEILKENFEMNKGDLLILTFAKDYRICENSAIAVADRIKKIRI